VDERDDVRPGAALPLADLERAVEGGLAVVGHLLTRGEWVVVDRWRSLPVDARSLYARLFSRKDRMLSVSGLHGTYDEVPDVSLAVDALAEAGFAWTTRRLLPLAWLFPLYDRGELSSACRALGLRRSGSRSALEARLLGEGAPARSILDKSGLRLRHRGLLRRLCRAFLGRHDGDLRALVLHRMGVMRVAEYTPAAGPGPYPDRRTLVAHESARRWAHALERAGQIGEDDLARAILMVESAPDTPPALQRFRARRYGIRVVSKAAESLERAKQPEAAVPLWQTLHDAGAPDVARRLALCLERSGAPARGVAVCVDALTKADPVESLALARTGRRLARKAKRGWRPSPPLRRADRRRLKLASTGTESGRPTWQGLHVEAAVTGCLEAGGRRAVRSENLLWTTLFGMLLRDVVFAPVPGMLPGAMQAGPLDLGRRGFARRRERWLGPALEAVRGDAGVDRLSCAFQDHLGEAIWGVSWTRWTEPELRRICEGLGGPLLARVLEALAHGASRNGLPDLLVLPGERVRLDHLFPGRLPAGPLFVEVKGPGDQLRDGQLVWLHRLLGWGAHAEVWDVEALGESGGTPRQT